MDTPSDARGRRLDELLVSRGLFATRSRARDAILRGAVRIDGVVARKAGQPVAEAAAIAVADPAGRYVSRAALKLIHGLDAFGFDPVGRVCLDIGASTGGFTQVLLERGAGAVFALDVGHGQLAPELAADPRVTSLEGVNARALHPSLGSHEPGMVVCDVSFISVRLALPPALALAVAGAMAVILVKPQFEVGRKGIGKGGIVEPALAQAAAHDLRDWLAGQPGWRPVGLVPSPIAGGDGNVEFLLGGVKDA